MRYIKPEFQMFTQSLYTFTLPTLHNRGIGPCGQPAPFFLQSNDDDVPQKCLVRGLHAR